MGFAWRKLARKGISGKMQTIHWSQDYVVLFEVAGGAHRDFQSCLAALPMYARIGVAQAAAITKVGLQYTWKI